MRKLMMAALSLSLAVFLAWYLLPPRLLLPGALLCAALSGLLFLFRGRHMLLYRLALCALGAAIGLGVYCLHWNRTIRQAENLDGAEGSFFLRVMEYPEKYDRSTRIHLRMESWPYLDVMLYDYDRQEQTGRLVPGELVMAEAKLRRADLRGGERSGSYVSKNIYLTGTLRALQTGAGQRHSLRSLAALCSRRISDAAGEIFTSRTAVFMRALLLGDKADFYGDLPLYASMRGAGFMHVVAVSGMHIAFLVGMIQLLFGMRPASSGAAIGLVWFFVFMTGASPSAVRAGVMQTVLILAPVFRRENDGPTSLSFALALILLANPFSCASISLQLSFAAMAGMILLAAPLTELMESALHIPEGSRLHVPMGVLGASLAVMITSTPVSVMHFGTLALWSPLTNLLGLWAVSLCFCLGYATIGLWALFPFLAQVPAVLTELLAGYLMWLARMICRLPWHLIGMRSTGMLLWLLLCYGLVFIAWRTRAGSGFRFLLPLALCVLCLAFSLHTTRARYRQGNVTAEVLDVGQGACVCILSGDSTVMLDCGGIGAFSDAGETAATWLETAGRREVDLLVLSHMHEDHANGVPMLLELMPVRELVLSPDADYDEALLPQILESAARHGTAVHDLTADEERSLGRLRLRMFAPLAEGSENERCIMSLVSSGDFDLLFTGDSPRKAERELLQRTVLPDLEVLIVGHHGSRTATDPALLEATKPEDAVISVGRFNSYGHPTWEVLETLQAYGCRVYRTDLNGDVEIRVS
ncbi:MAG: DNA internalization-related competence protein ComEC/Rec2 [Oscillospiraceae bacterium]|nr:DNA internalization-related competence protein ComEC/Rec2 [Oscillospiraceae bacterium]